jgi:sugar-phosphatase
VVQIGGDKRLDGGVRARLEDWRQIRLTEDEAGLQLCMANLLPD